MSAKTPVKGHTSKHVHKASKHHKAKGKHHPAHNPNPVPQFKVVPPHAVGKPAGHPKPRGFALDSLPVCAFEAVAISARLAGYDLSEDDVAGLWDLLGAPEEGVAVGESLRVAARQGIGGVAPGRLDYVRLDATECGRRFPGRPYAGVPEVLFEPRADLSEDLVHQSHGLILGVTVPGPHAVLATADGWWSWGELWSPWPCRIEEAWAVSWS